MVQLVHVEVFNQESRSGKVVKSKHKLIVDLFDHSSLDAFSNIKRTVVRTWTI